jgi:gamma-glutamyl-gamma-aminobutyrate hydrolase PuuD
MKTLVLSSKISIDKHKKINFNIDQDLANFLCKLNVKILPINLKKNKIDLSSIKSADGLILAGGGDISKIKNNRLNQIRDDYEIKLFNYFYKNNKPILGICRGFQLIADLYKIKLFKVDNHVRKIHRLYIKKNNYILHNVLTVNSFHKYSIKNLPNEFINVASTNDGSIEIATHNSKKILCLMFHPERIMKSKNLILNSIKNFFK